MDHKPQLQLVNLRLLETSHKLFKKTEPVTTDIVLVNKHYYIIEASEHKIINSKKYLILIYAAVYLKN